MLLDKMFSHREQCAYRASKGLHFICGACGAILLAAVLAGSAFGQTSLTTLYNFSGVDGDGSHPIGDLIMDANGVLYGVTHGSPGDKIYQLIPPAFAGGEWTKVNIYNGNAPGTEVHGNFTPLIFGKHGELFGLSLACDNGPPHQGSCVFQLSPPASAGGAWQMSILAYELNFEYGDGRIVRTGTLAIDSNGNLYGITHRRENETYGTAYQLSPSGGGAWTQTLLYKFLRFPPPFIGFWEPQDGLVIDQNGALYGSTTRGRVVYRLSPPTAAGGAWSATSLGGGFYDISGLTISPSGWLYAVDNIPFRGHKLIGIRIVPGVGPNYVESPFNLQGSGPGWELVSDKSGVLYGTDRDAQVVYKVIPPAVSGGDWSYSVRFSGSDGSDPFGRLLMDESGNLFGATLTGGTGNRCHNYPPYPAGCGTVFELQ